MRHLPRNSCLNVCIATSFSACLWHLPIFARLHQLHRKPLLHSAISSPHYCSPLHIRHSPRLETKTLPKQLGLARDSVQNDASAHSQATQRASRPSTEVRSGRGSYPRRTDYVPLPQSARGVTADRVEICTPTPLCSTHSFRSNFRQVSRPSDLKNLCLVSKETRGLVLPCLYRTVVLSVNMLQHRLLSIFVPGHAGLSHIRALRFQERYSMSPAFDSARHLPVLYGLLTLIPKNSLRVFE